MEFVVGQFLSNQSAKVRSPKLHDLIQSNSCEIFSYLNPLYYSPSYITYTISPFLSIFLCDTSSTNLKESANNTSKANYYSYEKCPGSTIYFPHPNYAYQNSSNFPSNCKPVRLPIKEGSKSYTDLFSFLGNEFTLEWNVSSECTRCHLDGGQCSGSIHDFHCAKGKKDDSALKNNLKIILAVTVITGFAILLFCLLILVIRFSKYLKFKLKNDRKVEDFLKNHGSLSPKRYTHSQVKKMTKSFKTKLGQGGYGSVFKGKLNNGHDVAVKLLKEVKGSGEEFFNEVATISRTSHVNIVSLLGYCYEGHNRALIYEYMPNGSLEKFICDKNSKKNKLGWDELYNIVIGVARGLEYLHRGCNSRILHLDIKPHNILLDEDFCPKISDFGLAKLCFKKESIVSLLEARGTIGYIAPEVFCRNFGGVSRKSDVYSYGMMVLEMVGERESEDIEAEVGCTSDIYFPNWIYKRLEQNKELGLMGVINEDANDNLSKMIIVGLWCIQTSPTHRPSMSKVMEMLEGSLDAMEIPPKPYMPSQFISVDHSSTISLISSNYSE